MNLFLSVDAETDAEALQDSKGVIHVLNRLIATNHDDGSVECLCGGVPLGDAPLPLCSRRAATLPRHQRSPPMIFLPVVIAGEPHPAFGAIGRGEGDWVG